MKLSMRPSLAGIVGVALNSCLWQLAVYNRPTTYESGLYQYVYWLFSGPVLQAVLYLLPWFVVGLISAKRPVLTASISGLIGESIRYAFFLHAFDWPNLLFGLPFSLAGAAYGAAGGALGSIAMAANNSFKPKPLRGSA
jgi:hypothetical protein